MSMLTKLILDQLYSGGVRFDQSLFIKCCYIKHRHLNSALNLIKMRAGAGPDRRYDRGNQSPNRGGPAISVEYVEENAAAASDVVSTVR